MFSLLTDYTEYAAVCNLPSSQLLPQGEIFYNPAMRLDWEKKKYRKYGTKIIASIGVRSYYRCTSGSCQCPHRKWVTRHNDGSVRVSTYNQHTCDQEEGDEKRQDWGVVPPLRVDRLKRRPPIALIVVCKRTNEILRVSRTYIELLLAEDDSFIGQPISAHLMPLLTSDDYGNVMKMFRDRIAVPMELRLRTTREWKVCMIHVIQDWDPELCVMMWQDVTPTRATAANMRYQ